MPDTVTLDPRELDPPAAAAQSVTLDPAELDKPATQLSGPPASLSNPSQRLPSAQEAASMADQTVMGTLKSLWQSATRPIPQTVHDLLGTGEKVQSMRDSGAAVGEAARQGIDKFMGAGSASKIARDFPALGFAGNLADQGLQAAGGVLDFATSPAGVATLATPALPAVVQPAVGAGFGASMLPGAAESTIAAIKEPTSQNVAKSVVDAGMAMLPVVHPIAKLTSDAIEARRAEAPAAESAPVTLDPAEVKPAENTVTLSPDEVKPAPQSSPVAQPTEQPEARAAPPTSENPAEPPKPAVTLDASEVEKPPLTGDSAVAKTAAGTKIDTHYEVKPIADLIASHDTALNENPKYPQELQPRDRTRKASDQQINEIAGKLDPEELGASYKASDGAPIVGPDNVVESGNGRSIALMRLYEQDHPNGETYRQWLIDNSHRFGIDPVEVSNVENPVLVRVRDTPVDRAQFAREANGQTVQSMSPSEQAAADSPQISGDLMRKFAPSEDGSITNAANRDFVRGFMDQVLASPGERNRYQTGEGEISQDGVNRIRNAVFHKAYGDTSTIEKMAESTDSNVKNITTGMLQAAPKFAQTAEGIAAGELHPIDFAPDVAAAAEKLSALRDQGTAVDDYLNQGSLFGEDMAPEAKTILEVMNGYRRSPKKLGTFLQNLADQVEGLGNPKQKGMFGGSAVPSKEELLTSAIRQTEKEYGQSAGDLPGASGGTLFERQAEGTGSSEAGAPGTGAEGAPESAGGPGAAGEGPGNVVDKGAVQPRRGRGAVKKVLGTDNKQAGALDISDLVKAIDERFPADIAKANYSGIGAAKDTFVRNLSQLEEASPEAHAAAVRAAASKSQVAVLLRSAVPQIEKALGPDLPWEKFRTALVESRLRGIRARWEDWARQAGNKSVDGFRKGMQNGLMNILEQIEGQRGIPQDVRETALALLHNLDGEKLSDAEQLKLIDNADGNNLTKVKQLQKFLSDTFSDAARGVAKVMEPEDFDAVLNHPNFDAGLQAYKDLLEKPVAENHALNEGAFSTALGPAGTYYPLVPLEEAQAPDISQKRPTPFAKPKNIANDLATGLAPAYDTSMSALEQRLSRAIKGNNKAAMFDSLESAGLLKPLDVGERAGPFMELNGERYHAKTIELSEPQQRMVKGSLENVPAKFALVPDWLHKELEPIVKRADIRLSRPRQIVDAITQAALAGPSDFVFHATNLLGTMVANTPFLGDSLGAKVVGNTPFTKVFTAITKIVGTDPSAPEASADLMDMAKAGVLPDKFGSVTYSRKFAEQTGADLKRLSPAPILYGPKGLDVRARLVMWRLSKELAPNDTLANRAKFTNQLGNYVTALQGPIERAMKNSVAPFYTAGSTMYRNGLNALLGTGPVPGNKFEYRVQQQLSAGLAGTVATWVIAHRAMTGKWPWDDRKSKFMQLPIPEGVRRSPAGIAMFGKGRDTGYVNMSFFNPILTRGARAAGVSGAYNTHALGGNAAQSIESAIKDMGNSVIEPATTGPLVKAGAIMATGNEPYATSINPFRMMPATDAKKHGAAMLADRAKESVLNMNSFFQNLGAATGIGHKSDEISTKGDRWLKMATSLALPRLLTQSDVGKQAAAVAKDRRTIHRDELRDR